MVLAWTIKSKDHRRARRS